MKNMQNAPENFSQDEQQRLSEELLATCEQLQEENERFRQEKKDLEKTLIDLKKSLSTSLSDCKVTAYREAKLREELDRLMEKQHIWKWKIFFMMAVEAVLMVGLLG